MPLPDVTHKAKPMAPNEFLMLMCIHTHLIGAGRLETEQRKLITQIEYKSNYVQFISNDTVTEQQMQVVSATINKLEEPVYDHRTRIRERS